MLVLDDKDRDQIKDTVKMLVEERDALKRKLEIAEAKLHAARILIDQLKKGGRRG